MVLSSRIRALLLLNAVIALTAFTGAMGWRVHSFRADAARYASREELFREEADWMAEEAETARSRGFDHLERALREDAERERRLADYYRDMHARYQRAARYPWLSIGPDPPRPRYSELPDRDGGQ